MKKKSTIIALILCAAMIAGILAGCGGTPNGGGGSEPDGSSGGGTAKDTIVVASQTEPTTLGTCDHAALASDYVNQLRVDRARTLLLATDQEVSRVSAECGYENPRTFNREFRRICGCTPREYRKKFVLRGKEQTERQRQDR